ncbi:ester cyclase [Puia sp. P3]|uniref:ester cyclase n=1 Tax=Puia sp. P3 TaxID=3423952 RepID=UPI003D6668B3
MTNKETVARLYTEGLNKRNWQLINELIAPEYEGVRGIKGGEGFSAAIIPLVKAFPDMQWRIDDLFGEEDKVVIRFHWDGTHQDTFSVYPATGKHITNGGIATFTVKDGRITEGQLQTDRQGFVQQVAAPASEQTCLIDKFFIPADAKEEFYERMKINRDFIKKLPGFIGDDAYTYFDDNDNLICVTVARWRNMDFINMAKEAVQAEYKRENFDMPAMLKRLNISIDRGVYRPFITE